MAKLSTAEWMGRYVRRLGSQRAVAEALGVSSSMVGKIVRGQRGGERFRDAARAGAAGRQVEPPPPTTRTPRRVRQPARVPTGGGSSRVITRSPRVAGREVERSRGAGRRPREFTVTLVGVDRSAQYRHKSAGSWSGPLTLTDLTDSQLDRLTGGTDDDVLSVLREEHPWLGKGRIAGITYQD